MSNAALAVPFTKTRVSTLSPCPSYCGGPGSSFDNASDGGAEFLDAYSELNNADGEGRAQANFAGINVLPELRADAFSNSGFRSSRVQSTATAMQQFFYSGEGGSTTISASIDGEIEGDGEIEASIVVMRADGAADPGESTDWATLVFEIIPGTSGLSELGKDRGILTSTGIFDLAVNFTVNATDTIFVWSQLSVTGKRGGSADSFNTMTMSLFGPAGFSPVLGGETEPVPEPGTLALFGVGMAALGLARRRKKAQANLD